MIKLITFAPFDWILMETNHSGFISSIMPKRFNYSCKILHPIYRDNNIKNEGLLWSQCNPDEEVQLSVGERLWYRDLAKKYNIAYTKDITSRNIFRSLGGYPRYMLLAEEGSMESDELEKIISVLQPFSEGEQCYFYYDGLKTVNVDPDTDGYLYAGDLENLIELSQKAHGSPTYWWNQSKTWCLYTDFDLNFSIVGGTKEVIDSLLSADSLECIETDRDSILGS